MTFRNTLVWILFTLICGSLVSLHADLRSSGWGSYGSREPEGESFQIPFKIPVKGTFVDGQVVLEGKVRIQHQQLTRYFKSQEMESQSEQSTEPDDSELSESDSFDMGAYVSLIDGGFKLLRLTPVAGTSHTTVEIYIGEDQQTPALEALDQRLNPFKKTPFEVVLSSFSEVDFRNVKAVVTLKTGVPKAIRDATFTAELNGYLVLGESYYEPGYSDEEYSESDTTLGSEASF